MYRTGYLRIGCVEGGGDGDLVLGARSDVEGALPHDWHVQVMHDGDLQSFSSCFQVPILNELKASQIIVATGHSKPMKTLTLTLHRHLGQYL